MSRHTFTFYLGDEDKELIKLLEYLGEKKERSDWIRQSLRFSLEMRENIEKITDEVTEIKVLLQNGIPMAGRSGENLDEEEDEEVSQYVLSGLTDWGVE